MVLLYNSSIVLTYFVNWIAYYIAYCIAYCIAYWIAYCIATHSSILTFRYASFGDDEIGKISYRWLDCYFTNFKLQIWVNIGQNNKNPQKYTYFHEISHFLFLGRPKSRKKKKFCDRLEKWLGPRPLGPIGPIFRRTMTVTGMLI